MVVQNNIFGNMCFQKTVEKESNPWNKWIYVRSSDEYKYFMVETKTNIFGNTNSPEKSRKREYSNETSEYM